MKKIFYISIDGVSGMDAISLVENPAVEYNFLCFDKEQPMKLQFNEDKHIISGVVCLADTPIYRYTEGFGEWWCVFNRKTIEQMVQLYSKNNLWNSINLQHDSEKQVDCVFMTESYIKDSKRGIVPVEFADIPDGSWCCSFYVSDDKLWNEIKNGNHLNGFSLQGIFDLVPEEKNVDEMEQLIDEILE